MDVVTQCVMGAAAGQALLARRLPRSAWLAGALGGYLPDADIFIRPPGDPLGGLLWHRHFTHGIGFMPLGALIAAAPFLLFASGRRAFGWVYLAALAGIATHGPLDAATSYGTVLWWPFTTRRVSWDLVGIIDPLVTFPLLIGVVIAAVASWRASRRSASGLQPTPPVSRRPNAAMITLVWAWVYIAVIGGVMHAAAQRTVLAAAQSRGHPRPTLIRTMPQPLTLLLWRSVYQHQGEVYAHSVLVRPWAATQIITGPPFPLLPLEGAHRRAVGLDQRQRRAIDGFYWFTDGWVAADPQDPAFLGDMRYSIDPQRFSAMWGLRIPAPGTPADTRLFGRPASPVDRTSSLWQQLTGNDPRFTPAR